MFDTSIQPFALIFVLAGLSVLPLAFVISTAFLKISMVLMILRNALGIQQMPPNIALYSIALISTLFVMAPVLEKMDKAYTELESPVENLQSKEDMEAAAKKVFAPMKEFIDKNSSPDVREHFRNVASQLWKREVTEDEARDHLLIMLPTFTISELEKAFKIGFLIYIPFVVIDLLISNILLALGMQMVAPIMIATPVKILLFILIEGWTKVLDGLMLSYL
ncbi:EscR/YscR/HrcR family type III secretion system export apparatus protein [Veronia nyctiphanis]|uniref:EscR/YscR/HrcR family type III secretion system export apparatus protein n=1 Tax=Veronia nyctiphanis TaxID=1278244 RepID=A0A4Q0YP54_9GAMM|nr:type III secretion system export apparatus subunit SctR [Veronia nyctiphanis]RXJ72265.1 EscR/YscR/HrcR family type III secretion system export apparatus protein [Veronia nyctiphanis]